MEAIYGGWGERDQTLDQKIATAERLFELSQRLYGTRENPSFEGPRLASRKFFAWDVSRKLFGKDILHIWQQTGSCVGASHGQVGNYSQVINIGTGKSEEFKYIYFPYHYGAGRRKAYGNVGKGEGSYGGPQADAISELGMIPEDIPGLPKITKTATDWAVSEATEMDWSGRDRDGSWDYEDHTNIGKLHLFSEIFRVTDAEKAADALIQTKSLINVCSNMGYGRLDSQGFNVNDRNWNHSMMFLGADLEWKIPYMALLNNWSDVHPRVKDFYTGELWPIGVMRIRLDHFQEMINQRDTYQFVGLNGFRATEINPELFNIYRGEI